MKNFFTAKDVEIAASSGKNSIQVGPNDVVTSIAKETANKLGVKFVETESATSTGTSQSTTVLSNGKVKALPYKGLISDSEVDKWRQEFPILKDVIHVANCSQSAQSTRVRNAINKYLDNWNTVGMDWDAWVDEVNLAKAEFAKVINADPSEIAISTSVSETISSIASALDYTGKRKKVVTTDAEFPTANYVWLAHQKYGAKVDFISVDENHQIELSEYERYIDEDTLITSITQVYYLNGFKQDVEKIAEIAHRKGSLILVDAYQGLGTEPIDVKKMNIDILTTGNLKYLFGIPGIAFMYVNKDLVSKLKPSETGWFGQDNPFLFQSRYLDWANTTRRFDTGTPPVLTAYAAKAGLEIINEVGVEKIKDRIDMLSAHCLQGCLDRNLNTVSPLDVSKKGGTTAIRVPDEIDSHHVEVELRKRNIIASARGDVIRVAPHFYTKKSEIDTVLDNIADILN
ncbi:MAG: aminotransferase class V-fold PLP-dependent enzyme [Bacillota bacterium]|nr:aminotransferase class V-fold PLP-dependent enzyme [Bacillota bacterium]